MKTAHILLAIAGVVLCPACGGSGTGYVNSVLAPNAPAPQEVDVAVTATFSGGVMTPATWTEVLSLTLEGSSDDLCTSIDYNSNTHVATCFHNALEYSSSYQISVQSYGNILGAVQSFTTIAPPSSITTPPEGEDAGGAEGTPEEIPPGEGIQKGLNT